jgi:uncharacterized protein (TIGR02266 family)
VPLKIFSNINKVIPMQADQELDEKRDSRRYMARMAVFYGHYKKTIFTNYSINMSTGGMFIESENILPVDSELVVKFKLPDSDRIIVSNARVAWTNDPDAIKKPSLPPGMGIQFLDLSLDDLHSIRAFLNTGDVVPTW